MQTTVGARRSPMPTHTHILCVTFMQAVVERKGRHGQSSPDLSDNDPATCARPFPCEHMRLL
eukprot:5152666-Alexandrium_andersonii.AAC.1